MTQENLDKLNAEQQRTDRHPATCNQSSDDCERSVNFTGVISNPRDAGLLIATADGWVCPCGAYKQPFKYI